MLLLFIVIYVYVHNYFVNVKAIDCNQISQSLEQLFHLTQVTDKATKRLVDGIS